MHLRRTNLAQIRIVVDSHQNEKGNKKKKKHRGYAFVVYEREKDMRGKLDHNPLPYSLVLDWMSGLVKTWPSSLPVFFLLFSSLLLKV